MISKKAQVHLEHVIFNSYKTFLQKDISSSAKLVVAVSGGKDSMALLKAMTQVFPKSQMVVAHFHHGDFFNKEFRDQALSLVQKFCTSEYLLLEYEKSLDFLKSESDCRKARMDFFSRLMTKHNSSVLVLAHHLDDWLETQLIKLIRGCSFESLNQNLELSTFLIDAVKIYKWRPWIRTMQREILEYVNEKKISF
ncbi:MAG: tRNA lysidine(34) synthetase TilS, partial [Bdellovibrionaceae bacterium]|nr:tRNA lysidine(34) synthetase TilS [Pseudobdellovibrionaceae bacterium]